jgi:Mg-chelatase subunit ChlI
LDRFALSVEIRGLNNVQDRMDILERHIAFDTNPVAFREEWMSNEVSLSQNIESARDMVDTVKYSNRDLYTIANLTSSMHVDGHRADLVILKTARANAAFEGRKTINDHDILIAAELALPHRMKRGPFADGSIGEGEIESRMDEIASEWEESDAGDPSDASNETSSSKKKVTP